MGTIGFRSIVVGGALLLALTAQTQTSAQAQDASSKESADLQATCSVEMAAAIREATAGGFPASDAKNIVVKPIVEIASLDRQTVTTEAAKMRASINPEYWKTLLRCVYARRIAQLDGATLVAGGSRVPAATTTPSGNARTSTQRTASLTAGPVAGAALTDAQTATILENSCRAQARTMRDETAKVGAPINEGSDIRMAALSDLGSVQKDIKSDQQAFKNPDVIGSPSMMAYFVWKDCLLQAALRQLTGNTAGGSASERSSQANAQGVPSQQGRAAVVPSPEGSNSANDATHCVELIGRDDFAAKGVKTIMLAVFRNSCPYDITVTWCIVGSDCKPGYSNLGDISANKDRGISIPAADQLLRAKWAACKKNSGGFIRGQYKLSPKLKFGCQ